MKPAEEYIYPMQILDKDQYPTDEFVQFIRDYKPSTMPILDLVALIEKAWWFGWGFELKRKYKGVQKLKLSTGGWSGNEEIISAIKSNIYLTAFSMKYEMWKTGGHHYFEIPIR